MHLSQTDHSASWYTVLLLEPGDVEIYHLSWPMRNYQPMTDMGKMKHHARVPYVISSTWSLLEVWNTKATQHLLTNWPLSAEHVREITWDTSCSPKNSPSWKPREGSSLSGCAYHIQPSNWEMRRPTLEAWATSPMFPLQNAAYNTMQLLTSTSSGIVRGARVNIPCDELLRSSRTKTASSESTLHHRKRKTMGWPVDVWNFAYVAATKRPLVAGDTWAHFVPAVICSDCHQIVLLKTRRIIHIVDNDIYIYRYDCITMIATGNNRVCGYVPNHYKICCVKRLEFWIKVHHVGFHCMRRIDHIVVVRAKLLRDLSQQCTNSCICNDGNILSRWRLEFKWQSYYSDQPPRGTIWILTMFQEFRYTLLCRWWWWFRTIMAWNIHILHFQCCWLSYARGVFFAARKITHHHVVLWTL